MKKINIIHFIPPIFFSIYRRLKKTPRNYMIGQYAINLPKNFALPETQRDHKLYDRFLPVLVKSISSDKLIIDVGGNIGDTTIAILQHCENPILCIEPSEVFYPFLVSNLNICSVKEQERVTTLKNFVGTGQINGTLNHSTHGTASLRVIEGDDQPIHSRLDDLVMDHFDVSLVKIDTDGFDFDVLNSAGKILASCHPILFWENYIEDDFQLIGFDQAYSMLLENDYTHVYIFDNFGNLIIEDGSFSNLRSINSYLYSMREYEEDRKPFHYTDVLACSDERHGSIKKAIDEYKSKWINAPQ